MSEKKNIDEMSLEEVISELNRHRLILSSMKDQKDEVSGKDDTLIHEEYNEIFHLLERVAEEFTMKTIHLNGAELTIAMAGGLRTCKGF